MNHEENDDDDTVISPEVSESSSNDEDAMRIKKGDKSIEKTKRVNNRRDTIFNPGAPNN
jgi:hypothetical protein